jgi:hypothetical protein
LRWFWPRIFGYRTEFRIELFEKIWHNKRIKIERAYARKGYNEEAQRASFFTERLYLVCQSG